MHDKFLVTLKFVSVANWPISLVADDWSACKTDKGQSCKLSYLKAVTLLTRSGKIFPLPSEHTLNLLDIALSISANLMVHNGLHWSPCKVRQPLDITTVVPGDPVKKSSTSYPVKRCMSCEAG